MTFPSITSSFSGLSVELWLLALVNFINRVGAMVICFLTLYLTNHLHFSLEQAGYVLSFYGLGAIAGSYLGGFLTDKLGYQKVQLLSLTSSACMLFLLMYVEEYYTLCATLFVYNLVAESFRPANSIAVKMNSHEKNRTRAYSLLRTAFNLAITFALSLGGFLILWGWHWIFIVDGLTCLAAAVVLFFFVPEIKTQKSNNQIDKAEIFPTISPYKDKKAFLFFALTLLNALVFMQILWTVPPFFKEIYHWSEAKIGMVCAVNGFVVMLVEIPLVFVIEKKKTLLAWVRLGLICYALSYAALLLPFPYLAGLLYMVIISFGEIGVMPFSTTWLTRRGNAQTQGKYMGIYGMTYSLANTIAPAFGTQIISKFSYSTLWICLCVICVIVWLGFYYLEEQENSLSQ
ncbi:MAG: MFS transporter [Bacteroidia bacterium]